MKSNEKYEREKNMVKNLLVHDEVIIIICKVIQIVVSFLLATNRNGNCSVGFFGAESKT